jgi:IMP dehydrogenase
MFQEALTYNDVQIVPKFSLINSRKEIDLTTINSLKLPVISSNMDTVTESTMAKAMAQAGGVGCLHRFMSIEDNINQFKQSEVKPWVSVGLGQKEIERASALFYAGADTFVVDVAHGANINVIKQVEELRNLFHGNAYIVVGNFGDGSEISSFNEYLNDCGVYVDAYKVGIGGGSACTTRIKTGCGVPSFTSIYSCRNLSVDVIADGGIRTPGDIAKAIGAGAKAVMLGGMLAGTEEAPGEVDYAVTYLKSVDKTVKQPISKKYRGSASKESYEVQGKDESWRTAEGESFTVPYKGPVANILKDIEGGLRSAFSYVGASNLKEFKQNVSFIRVTNSGINEAKAHGKQ